MKTWILIVITLLAMACSPKGEQEQAETDKVQPPVLTEVWASDTLLQTPESVLYDKVREVI